jgi:hypothetical protein
VSRSWHGRLQERGDSIVCAHSAGRDSGHRRTALQKPAHMRFLDHPRTGSLTSQVFENRLTGLPRAVYLSVENPLAPFELDGEVMETSVRLDLINCGVDAWRKVEHQTFTFPVNPTPGCIDGSIYLGGAHHPADVTRIAFGPIRESRVAVELDVRFDFTYEGLTQLGTPDVTWRVELVCDPDALDATDAAFAEHA